VDGFAISSLAAVGWLCLALGVTAGGMRFHEWSLRGRIGQPRFPQVVETVMVWGVYGLLVSFVAFWARKLLIPYL